MKKKCPGNETLYRYFFDTLTSREKKRVMKHLNHCPSCQEEFSVVQAILYDPDLLEWDSLSHQETAELMHQLDISNLFHTTQPVKNNPINISKLNRFISNLYFDIKEDARFYLEKIRMSFFYRHVPAHNHSFQFYAWHSNESEHMNRWMRKKAVTRTESHAFENMIAIHKKFKQLKLDIYFEKSSQDNVLMRVNIKKRHENIQNTFVTLINKESKMAMRQFKDGWAYIENLQFSSYRVVFTQGENEVGTYAFELSEAGLDEK